MKQHRQLVLVVCETSSSFTCSCLIDNKRSWSLLAGLLRFCLELRPLARPQSVVRVDPAPGVFFVQWWISPPKRYNQRSWKNQEPEQDFNYWKVHRWTRGRTPPHTSGGSAFPLFPWLSLLLTSTSPSTTDSYQLVKCGSNVISSPIRICLIFIWEALPASEKPSCQWNI